MTATDKAYLGLDVGGTNIKYGLVDGNGTVVWGARVPTPALRPLPVTTIADIAADALAHIARTGAIIAGVGIAAPGRVDPTSGVVLEASNLQWKDAPLGPALEDRFGFPVKVVNDTNAAALGELTDAAPTGVTPDLMCISIGTGVGAGLIIGGHLYTGQNFAAGELGHVVADADGRPCACGRVGCLETIASGPGIVRAYREATTPTEDNLSETAPLALSTVAAKALRGEPAALAVLTSAASALGTQVANCSTLLDISDFVISGGVANMKWPLVPAIHKVAWGFLNPGRRTGLRVRKSEMIDRAAILGAVRYLREHVYV